MESSIDCVVHQRIDFIQEIESFKHLHGQFLHNQSKRTQTSICVVESCPHCNAHKHDTKNGMKISFSSFSSRFTAFLRVLLIGMIVFLDVVDGKRKKSRTTDVRNRTKSFSEFSMIIGIILTALILPLIGTFIYKIVKDPATPGVIAYYWNSFKSNGFGYLGSKETVKATRPKKVTKSN